MMEITTKDGEASSTPELPSITDDGIITEKCLAVVRVNAGVTEISQADITDTRADGNVCGWVTGLIQQVSTETLFLQWQAAYAKAISEMGTWMKNMTEQYDSWFKTLTKDLNVNTYIKKYYKKAVLDPEVRELVLDIEEYEYEPSDIILVHVNGLLANESDYEIALNDGIPTVKTKTNEKGTVVEAIILKSKIGNPAPAGGDGVGHISKAVALNRIAVNDSISVRKVEEE